MKITQVESERKTTKVMCVIDKWQKSVFMSEKQKKKKMNRKENPVFYSSGTYIHLCLII